MAVWNCYHMVSDLPAYMVEKIFRRVLRLFLRALQLCLRAKGPDGPAYGFFFFFFLRDLVFGVRLGFAMAKARAAIVRVVTSWETRSDLDERGATSNP